MCTCGMRADVTCASMWGQMREELEEAGLGKEQVDVLQDLYQRAKQEEMLKNEAPAPALAEEDAAAEAVASTQVRHNVVIKPPLPCHRAHRSSHSSLNMQDHQYALRSQPIIMLQDMRS